MVADSDMVFRTFLRLRTSDFAGRRLPVAKQVFGDRQKGGMPEKSAVLAYTTA
jgi:hypothetical protein